MAVVVVQWWWCINKGMNVHIMLVEGIVAPHKAERAVFLI
jgi:hypothetical protein